MLTFDFTGKTAIVTGGGQGIGRSITEALLKAGARVWLIDSDAEAGTETAADLNSLGTVEFILTDVADAHAVESMRQRVAAAGGVDLLVNNAAIMVRKPLEELAPEEWHRVLDVNLTGPFLCSRAFADMLRSRHGSIVNIASTRALSLGPAVRVNCISPGWIDVSSLRKRSRHQTMSPSEQDHAQHPAGRVGRPEDIAAMVLYLSSTEAGFITGENIVIDGGMTRKMIYDED
jgi:NAD(P)-dependent dehydrogenase (short-subunit alcohol dehydrogenase family)